MPKDRPNVWLGVSALVVNEANEWLMVKKKYGGLKGKWSFPAGFVENDETVDEAAIREVKEETGVDISIHAIIGFRTGVIQEIISDNMVIFRAVPISQDQPLIAQTREIEEVAWLSPLELKGETNVSVMVHHLVEKELKQGLTSIDGIHPGNQFGYSSYKLFFE
ncbi:NUDIX domain-containing protein [Paenisporosarcina cavernae]|nr:NUDIX hydrolase [Paenisporosarcina cavernae]